MINFADVQRKVADVDPADLFMESFLNLVNFLERERRRRPVLAGLCRITLERPAASDTLACEILAHREQIPLH
jgi:hypothetical protein